MSTVDQSTQVNFPVLLRSQQRALKRYATLADIKPRYVFNHHQIQTHHWHQSRAVNHLSRPRSLNLTVEEVSTAPIRRVLSNTGTRSPSCNTLSLPPLPRQYSTDSRSYTGSDVSLNDRYSQASSSVFYNSVHHSKWATVDSPSTPNHTMCTCYETNSRPPNNMQQSTTTTTRVPTTADALSWRRLHMSRAKLKATATTSELLSGFAMVAMVELQINEPTTVPEWLFVLFAVCTTVLVAVHIFALMISTYILPNIDAISKLDVCELVSESPHERMRGFIELAWAFSTVLGLFLFLVEIAILCWVKFWDYSFPAAIAATVIVIPVLILFVAFAVHFYHSLVVYKCDKSVTDMKKLEEMKKELDQATSPV